MTMPSKVAPQQRTAAEDALVREVAALTARLIEMDGRLVGVLRTNAGTNHDQAVLTEFKQASTS
jgi:hypothetical protein